MYQYNSPNKSYKMLSPRVLLILMAVFSFLATFLFFFGTDNFGGTGFPGILDVTSDRFEVKVNFISNYFTGYHGQKYYSLFTYIMVWLLSIYALVIFSNLVQLCFIVCSVKDATPCLVSWILTNTAVEFILLFAYLMVVVVRNQAMVIVFQPGFHAYLVLLFLQSGGKVFITIWAWSQKRKSTNTAGIQFPALQQV